MSSFNNFRGEKHTLPFSAFRPICQNHQNLTSSSSRQQSRNYNYQYHSSLDQFSYPDPNYHIRQQNINYYPHYFQQHQQWEQSIHQQRQLQQQQQQLLLQQQQQRQLLYLQHEQRQQLQKKQLYQRKFYQYCPEQNQQNTFLHVPLNNNDNSTQLQSRRQSKPVTVKQNRIKSADSPSLYSNRSGIGDKSFGRKCEIRKPGYNKNDPICIDIDDDEKKITGSSRKRNEQHPLDKPPAAITGKGNELIGLFNDASDVIIVEKEKEASTDAYDDNTNINITIDDDVCIIIGSTGKNFIHAREHCVIESFAIDPHKYCKKCFCYVCDMNASDCANWGSHCHAKSSESKWKNLRSKMRSNLTATATTTGSPSISSRKNYLGKEAKQNNI